MKQTKISTPNNDTEKGLSAVQCSMIRGIAILGIVLHNYCHLLPNIVKENEYTYAAGNVQGVLHYMVHPNVLFPIHWVSFFGHYGVPLFVFLSAYGLEKKYTLAHSDVKLGTFMLQHYLKLLIMLTIGFSLFTLTDFIVSGSIRRELAEIPWLFSMSINISVKPNEVIYPGSYWFFGLMLQLYLVYKLCIYKRHWGFIITLIVVSLLVQAHFLHNELWLNIIRYNSIGSLLPFGLGALYARHSPKNNAFVAWVVCVFSALAIVVGSIWATTWLIVPFFVCTFGVSVVKILPSFVLKPLAFVGTISSALFVIHPLFRLVFLPMGRSGAMYQGLTLYVLIAILGAFMLQPVINKCTKKVLSWL